MGKRISSLRKQCGLTQDQLAARVGVTAQAVSKWENDISCPDISILAKLAETLGVTTDELLGVKPVEPRVVVVESDKKRSSGAKKQQSFTFRWDGGKRSAIFLGLLVALVGLALLLERLGLWPFAGQLSFWGIVWPATLLGLGVAWMCERFSLFNLALAALGLYYLLFNLGAVTYELTWSVIWPALLILFGLSLLLDQFLPKRRKKCGVHCTNEDGEEHEPVIDYSDDEGFVNFDCSFADANQVVSVEEFVGGDVDISFGKATIDLTGCKRFVAGARLKVDVSFGSGVILLPRTVRLDPSMDRAFGSSTVTGEPLPDAVETLQLRGDVSFGSLVLRYV